MRNWKRIMAAVGTAALLISNIGAVSQVVMAGEDMTIAESLEDAAAGQTIDADADEGDVRDAENNVQGEANMPAMEDLEETSAPAAEASGEDAHGKTDEAGDTVSDAVPGADTKTDGTQEITESGDATHTPGTEAGAAGDADATESGSDAADSDSGDASGMDAADGTGDPDDSIDAADGADDTAASDEPSDDVESGLDENADAEGTAEEPSDEDPEEDEESDPVYVEYVNRDVDGVTVTAKVIEGAIPEGYDLHVRQIEDEDELSDIEDALNESDAVEEFGAFVAFDVNFANADGEEIEPEEGKVQVAFAFDEDTLPIEIDPASIEVQHFDESGDELEVVTVADTTENEDTGDVDVAEPSAEDVAPAVTVTFEVKSFSVFTFTGVDLAAVTDDGNGSCSMKTGDTLVVNDQSGYNRTYVESYSSGGRWDSRTYYSSSSDTNVATLSIDNGRATIKAVGTGTATVTLYYRSNNYGYGGSYRSVQLNITVSGAESATLYFLASPSSDPMTNATGDWVPDSTKNQSDIVAKVDTAGATWEDWIVNNRVQEEDKNITANSGNYIVSWPDGSERGDTWSIDSNNTYFEQIRDLVFDAWKSEFARTLGIADLSKDDITGITITPCKISRNNGTNPDKHIDCRIVLVSNKFYKTQFWVKEPGASGWNLEAYRFFREKDTIPKPNSANYPGTGTNKAGAYTYSYEIGDTRTVGGTRYVLKGWYAENNAGEAYGSSTTFAHTPTDAELEDGIVNFYAEWVPVVDPDITVKKVDAKNPDTLLSGAGFTLQATSGNQSGKWYSSYNDDTKTTTWSSSGTVLTTGDDGTITFHKIPEGTYTLTETQAPGGYQRLTESITLTVGENGVAVTGSDSASVDDYVVTVKNEAGVVMPETGGTGARRALVYSGMSMLFTSFMIYGYVSRRKRERRFGS